MKKIFLIILSAISFSYPQDKLIYFFSGDDFNPLTYDNNVLALYDGDVGLTASTWEDQKSTNDITFTTAPAEVEIVAGAINGHNVVKFDPIDGNRGTSQTPTINQPSTTYIVFKQITWGSNLYIFDGYSANTRILLQLTSTPNLGINAGTSLNSNPDLALDTYGIITVVFNGANSQIRTNTNAAATGNAGTTNSAGITLGGRGGTGYNSDIEVAYLVIRSGVDDLVTQNKYIAFLKTRFGL